MPIRAEAHWLACTDKVCVPEQGELLARPAGRQRHARARAVRRLAPRACRGRWPASAQFALARRQAARRHPASGQRRRSASPTSSRSTTAPVDYAAPQTFRRTGDLLIAELDAQARRAQRASPACSRSATAAGSSSRAVPGAVPEGGTPLGGLGCERDAAGRCSARSPAASCST